jgi:hypothetical protein
MNNLSTIVKPSLPFRRPADPYDSLNQNGGRLLHMVESRWDVAVVTMRTAATAVCAALLLVSCGRPDASGIYLHAADRRVTLVQLVQAKDGKVSGRLEDVTIGADGSVNDQAVAMDGEASGHDLMLKPGTAWYGGVNASGSFSGNQLALAGAGFALTARKSSLANYQTAVAKLRSLAARRSRQVAVAQSAQQAQAGAARLAQAEQAAQAQTIQDASNKTEAIESATVQLGVDTARLNAGVAQSPNFGQQSAANTARIAGMMQAAPTVSATQRSQLILAANQVEVGTNQIAAARSQYAIALDQIFQHARPIAEQIQAFCGSAQGAQGAQFAQVCGPAKAAAADYQASLTRGRTIFLGYQQAIQDDLARQSAMIQRMGG